jgi:hypothetical protein
MFFPDMLQLLRALACFFVLYDCFDCLPSLAATLFFFGAGWHLKNSLRSALLSRFLTYRAPV